MEAVINQQGLSSFPCGHRLLRWLWDAPPVCEACAGRFARVWTLNLATGTYVVSST